MKNHLYVLSFFVLLFSCSKPEEESFFEVQGNDLILSGSEGAADSVKVLTNIGWRAVITPKEVDWLQVSPALGHTTSAIVVTTTKQNFSGAPRNAFIDVIPSDTVRFVPRQYIITQNSLSPELGTNVANLNLAGTIDATETFTIQSNLNWSITTTGDWLTINSANGSNNATIEVKALKANNYRTARTATITITPIGNTVVQPVTIVVSQASIAPGIDWSKVYGGSGTEGNFPIIKTNDGGYLMVGYTTSIDRDISGHHGSPYLNSEFEEGFVVKVDANGNKQWSKVYGGTKKDMLTAAANTNDGGYILAGTTSSWDGDVFRDPYVVHNGNQDAWLLKIEGNGKIMWSRIFGGNYIDVFNDVVATADGGFVAAGYSIVDGELYGNGAKGSFDAFILKADRFGERVWSNIFGGKNHDFAYSLVGTDDGGFILAGATNSSDGDAVGSNNTGPDFSDGFLIKVDGNGNKIWSNTYGGSKDDVIRCVINSGGGTMTFIGNSNSNDGVIAVNKGSKDYWIMQVDAVGHQKWSKTYGGTGIDMGERLIKTKDGGFLATGSSRSRNGDFDVNYGFIDAAVIKLDPVGNKLWIVVFGGSNNEAGMGDDVGMGLVETDNGHFILSGTTSSSNGDIPVNYGSSDVWLLKFKAP